MTGVSVIEKLTNSIEASLTSMEYEILSENYHEFFEAFGDEYHSLMEEYERSVEYDEKDGQGRSTHTDKIYDLIHSNLIPSAVELMKESWTI